MSTNFFYLINFSILIFIFYTSLKKIFFQNIEDKFFYMVSPIITICFFSPIFINISIKLLDINFYDFGGLLAYQLDFYSSFKNYYSELTIINLMILVIYSLIYKYCNFNNKLRFTSPISLEDKKLNSSSLITLLTLTCALPLYLYYNTGCVKNNYTELPYLLSQYFSGKFFIFNLFFIYKLPLLCLLYLSKFKIRYKEFILILVSIIFLILNIRTASIFNLAIIIFFLFYIFHYKFKTIYPILYLLFFALFFQVKPELNGIKINTCFSSISIIQKYVDLTFEEFKPNSEFKTIHSNNLRGLIKNNSGEYLKINTIFFRILTRIDSGSMSAILMKNKIRHNTYSYIPIKLIPRFIWKDKPPDKSYEIINGVMDLRSDSITKIKINLFSESVLNLGPIGLLFSLSFYLFIAFLISYFQSKNFILSVKIISLYAFSNLLIFDDSFSMMLGNVIYDIVIASLILVIINLILKLRYYFIRN